VKTDTDKLHRVDEEFAERVGHRLRISVDELDAATLSRLNRARQAALDAIDNPTVGMHRRNRWLPVGAAVAVAAISVVLWQGQTPEPLTGLIIADEATDIELLLDDGDLEMYAELEFFAWLPEDELENIG
jgi:hypothetical protein